MSNTDMLDAAAATGTAMEQAVAIFMLHPETFGASTAAGYENPLAHYVAGRGGVLGEATGATVGAVFAVFEPKGLAAMWDEGVAVRGAAGAAQQYWAQAAEFGRKYLSGTKGLDRIAALGEKVISASPIAGLPLFAGWRAMPLADDAPARALQVMFVLRELRAGVHFNALTISGIAPVEAHMLNKGHQYTTMFGWPEPFADGADKRDRYAEIEAATNRRMTEIFTAALEPAEADELARLSTDALASMKAGVPG
ncbi:hypothetical protein [Mycobacterium sp. URHD0025]|uniref:SCO6745 family protein n=1 Tax=Mycobacterium sp. URHD0025 TaxID=1298864 RepID=UPI0004161721|nr:hypothetical protein [Mycobacterium sp. URHD0025]